MLLLISSKFKDTYLKRLVIVSWRYCLSVNLVLRGCGRQDGATERAAISILVDEVHLDFALIGDSTTDRSSVDQVLKL
jgi:hypothetical protein